MTEGNVKSGANEPTIMHGAHTEKSESEDHQINKDSAGVGKRALSAAALAAAVAAIALPLMRVRSVEAATAFCAADNYGGYDAGDPGDCADCFYAAFAVDCEIMDAFGIDHSGTGGDVVPGADHLDPIVDTPVDTPADTGGCGCGGCGDGGDYYGE